MAQASADADAAPTQEELTDAVLGASRVLLAIAVRSLSAAGEDITLVQFRALAVLVYRGTQRIADLAEQLAVNSSTATRLTDRLERKGLISRCPSPDDRRATFVDITDSGRHTVDAVMAKRRREVSRVVRKLPADTRRAVVDSLVAFTVAAGEAPEHTWALGWATENQAEA